MKQDLEELLIAWPLANDLALRPNDTVVVAGCFTGKVMDLLLEMYPGIYCHGFDPQQWALDRAKERLYESHPNGEWDLHPYGLAPQDAIIQMYDWETDAASIDPFTDRNPEKGVFRNFAIVMNELVIPKIDLFVMNMEGAEFTLLPYLMDTGLIQYIKKLAIQWHEHGRPHTEMNDLIEDLSDTHALQMDARPQWTFFVS